MSQLKNYGSKLKTESRETLLRCALIVFEVQAFLDLFCALSFAFKLCKNNTPSTDGVQCFAYGVLG